MSEKNIALLDQCIEHWEENVAAEEFGDTKIGPEHCALCNEYADWGEVGDSRTICVGCPIYEKTGMIGCVGSPYPEAEAAWDEWCDLIAEDMFAENHDGERIPEEQFRTAKAVWTMAAQAELDFLRALREELASGSEP